MYFSMTKFMPNNNVNRIVFQLPNSCLSIGSFIPPSLRPPPPIG